MSRSIPTTAVIALVLTACGPPPQEPPVVISDSAGARVVQINDLDQLQFPAWSTRLLFSTEGHDALTLAPTVQAAFTPDSGLWIAGVSEVLVFDIGGRLDRQVGRSGDGPGEFRQILHLGIAADSTVIISDFGSGRLTQFRLSGDVVRIIGHLGGGADLGLDPITMLADGRVLATYWQQRPNRAAVPGVPVGTVGRDSAPLLVLDSIGQPAGQLGLWAGRERARLDLRGEPSRLPLRFGRTAVYDGRNGMAVIGPTDSLDLAVFDDARLVLRMAARFKPVQPTAQAITDWERSVRLEAPGLGDLYLEAIARAASVPALPTVGAVVIDATGNIWVGSYSAQQGAPRLWRVFSRDGEPLGRLELPTLSPLLMPGSPELLDVFGDRLAVRRVTAAGETVVEVRAIVRP